MSDRSVLAVFQGAVQRLEPEFLIHLERHIDAGALEIVGKRVLSANVYRERVPAQVYSVMPPA